MPLPKHVQAQLDAADAQLAAMNATPTPPTPTPAPPPAPVAPEPAPQPAPPPPAPVPATPAPAPQDTWEQRYRSLQGIHRGLQNQFNDLKTQFTQLEQRISAPPPPAPTPAPKPVADPKDVEDFGLPMVTMVSRICEQYLAGAHQQIEAQFNEVGQQIAALRQAIQGTSESVALTAEQQFFAALDKALPKWPEINESEGFLAYLAEKDPIYGLPRSAALKNAQATGDAERAINIFKAYVDTLPPVQVPPPAGSPTPRSSAPTPPAPATDKPFIRASEVAKFYDDVKRGVFRGNPAEGARLEALYNAALAEGRVV